MDRSSGLETAFMERMTNGQAEIDLSVRCYAVCWAQRTAKEQN
jgi:hypothetical protein